MRRREKEGRKGRLLYMQACCNQGVITPCCNPEPSRCPVENRLPSQGCRTPLVRHPGWRPQNSTGWLSECFGPPHAIPKPSGFWLEGQKLNSSENVWKELVVNEICCMEWAQTTLKLQVRETFSCTVVRKSAAGLFFSSRGHASWSGIFKACNPLFLWGWCLVLNLV